MTDFEIAFAARCAAISDRHDDSDWLDVERRARRGARRRRLAIALVAAAAVLIAAPAFALRGTIVDFFSAQPAPGPIVRDFGSLDVGAPPGMAPGVDPAQARRVSSLAFDGKQHVLYVAPTKGGGFCESWTNAFGGCRATRTLTSAERPGLPADQLRAYNTIGVSLLFGADGLRAVGGNLLRPGSKLELDYADGDAAAIPYVWVSPPIDAGFFLYPVPEAHRSGARRATAVVVRDDAGNEIARSAIPVPPREGALHRLPDGQSVTTPPDAIWEKRQVIIAFRSGITGQVISLSVSPSRTGVGRCYWWAQGSGCPPPRTETDPPMSIGMSAAPRAVRLFGTFAPAVTRVVTTYQDGSSDSLVPTEGFMLREIDPKHYRSGHRVVDVSGYDADGRMLGRTSFDPAAAGVYPCVKPIDHGYGVAMCP